MAADGAAPAQVNPPTAAWWSAPGGSPQSMTMPRAVPTPARPAVRSRIMPGLMVLGAATVLAGSALPWLTIGRVYFNGTSAVLSTAFGINGWVTMAAAEVVILMAALMMISDERAVRWLGLLGALGTAGVTGYELIRVMQKIHYEKAPLHFHVGYGLVMASIAALVVLLAAAVEAAARD